MTNAIPTYTTTWDVIVMYICCALWRPQVADFYAAAWPVFAPPLTRTANPAHGCPLGLTWDTRREQVSPGPVGGRTWNTLKHNPI